MKNFAESLQKLKEQLGVNQTRIAEITGASQPTVQRWWSKKSLPDAEELCLLADYFEVSVDALLGRSPLEISASRQPMLQSDEIPIRYPEIKSGALGANEAYIPKPDIKRPSENLLKKGKAK